MIENWFYTRKRKILLELVVLEARLDELRHLLDAQPPAIFKGIIVDRKQKVTEVRDKLEDQLKEIQRNERVLENGN